MFQGNFGHWIVVALLFREIFLVAAPIRTDVHLGAHAVPVSDVWPRSLVLEVWRRACGQLAPT